jgi:hypothetical protein
MREFLNLLQPAYIAFRQKIIGGRFFIEYYNEIFVKMLENIHGNNYINIFTNKSSIFTRQRVINYCIFVKVKNFCMEQAPVKIRLLIVKSQADFLEKKFNAFKTKFFHGEKLFIINNVITDTYTTIRSL